MVKLQNAHDPDPQLADTADSVLVMPGEASPGTHEFYRWRSAISKKSIEEKGFQFIAVKGDWLIAILSIVL